MESPIHFSRCAADGRLTPPPARDLCCVMTSNGLETGRTRDKQGNGLDPQSFRSIHLHYQKFSSPRSPSRAEKEVPEQLEPSQLAGFWVRGSPRWASVPSVPQSGGRGVFSGECLRGHKRSRKLIRYSVITCRIQFHVEERLIYHVSRSPHIAHKARVTETD